VSLVVRQAVNRLIALVNFNRRPLPHICLPDGAIFACSENALLSLVDGPNTVGVAIITAFFFAKGLDDLLHADVPHF
jgi:hypothetical protein